jgi:hypothetical protein
MTAEQFEENLSLHLHRKPFLPFVVEKNDGTIIVVCQSNVAHGFGSGVFLSEDEGFVEFNHEDVRDIRSVGLGVDHPSFAG